MTPFRQPDDMDDFPQYIIMECKDCRWRDDFQIDTLNKEGEREGYCEDCECERIFTVLLS